MAKKSKSTKRGKVYLVGAGPGDPGLLTVRGAELLARAEVVVYDALVQPSLIKLAPQGAELLYAGKRSKDHSIPQDQLNQLLVKQAQAGKCVVRLKGGDPYVFGRGGEEAMELAEAGVDFEVVPGISSAVAAACYAGIPITHRDHCSSFLVITGHEEPGKKKEGIDWPAIARAPGTKVILMGVERIREIADTLMENGLAKTEPAAMVRWGTTGKQATLVSTLGSIADEVDRTGFKSPAIAIIGSVVSLRAQLNWFERRPLFGKRIVVTRTRQQASQLSVRLRELGAEVLEIPTIRIEPPKEKMALVEALSELSCYEWLVFTSPNGVTAFFDYFFKSFEDIRALGGTRIAAVGPATAAKLKDLHLRVDVMPEEYVAAKVASALQSDGSVENLKILLLRAEVANRELPKKLEEMGAIVDDVPVYRTVPETEDLHGVAADFRETGADWITFTSSSTVEHFNARFDLLELKKSRPGVRFLSIGPETSKAIQTLGLQPDLEARTHNIDGMIEALANWAAESSKA